ncbi:MAG: hypothetical protein GYB53_17010 [Rhodobacteraceae bacterium]|nr:hypothetical protein [Paracoccaceae bacterium]MBR9819757.1 hypothetical protein [Paracoccaceae bacterium]
MVESNKILTVSYGTFSCTLEGFDDAFDTMKAIAEYFRDLAADDRYFGAEPPTPDAEMLTRLAERNSARRVRARTEEGNIVLSPDSAQPDPQPEETRPEAVQPDPRQPEAAPAPATPAPADPTPVAEVEAEDVAEDEMPPRPMRAPRIAAALAAAGDAALLAADDTLDPRPARADAAPMTEQAARPSPVLPEIETPTSPSTAGLVEIAAPEALPAEHSATPEAAETPAESSPAPASTAEDISVNAPEARPETQAEPQTETLAEFPQDADAPEIAAEADGSLDDISEPSAADLAGEVALAADARQPDTAPLSDAETTDLSDDTLDVGSDSDLTPTGEGWDSIAEAEEAIAVARAEAEEGEDLPPASPAPTDVALKLQRIRDVVARRRAAARAVLDGTAGPDFTGPAATESDSPDPAPADPAPSEQASSDHPGAASVAEDHSSAAADAPDTTAEFPVTAAQESPLPQPLRPMARVIKVKRREAGDAAPEAAAEGRPASSLSAEEEDALQRELAAIEAEAHSAPAAPVSGQTDPQDPTADAPQSPAQGESAGQPARAGLAARSLRDTDHGAQMDRILRETDNHFEQEDSTRRRSALAHLRAAVAAKKAEKAAGSDFAPREDTTDAYREDLAQVVRPRRPAIAHQSNAPARRGVPTRPAPLKLVAEQRIDVTGRAQGPVRPRRVSIADLARRDDSAPQAAASASAPDESFADYAAAVGARSLGELLEAAASYMSFMEHQPLFSRPQLMSRVRSLQPEGFSREDGLRAFGQLLREGKIRKAEAGRFSVSDSIGFRPEERAAG